MFEKSKQCGKRSTVFKRFLKVMQARSRGMTAAVSGLAVLVVSVLIEAPLAHADDLDGVVHSVPTSEIPWISYRRLSFNLGVGLSKGSIGEDEVRSGVTADGITLDQFNINTTRIGYQLGIGYELTENLHLEAMYFNYGKVNVEASSTNVSVEDLAASFSRRLPSTGAGPLLALKYNLWVKNPNHRLFARLGFFHARSSYELSAGADIKRVENAALLGVGYEWFYKKRRSVRTEMNTSSIRGERVWYVGPTLVFYLDDVPREAMPVSEPEPKRTEQPGVVAKAGAFEPLRVTIYFDFDRSTIRVDQKERLRKVKEHMKTYPETRAIVSGHTDAYGTVQYNERLSIRRVNRISDDLIQTGAIDPARIIRTHHGELVPADGNADSASRQRNRRVSVCIVLSEQESEDSCNGVYDSPPAP